MNHRLKPGALRDRQTSLRSPADSEKFDVQPGSNKVTAQQLDKLTSFARQLTNNCILLMSDCDEKESLGSRNHSGNSAKRKSTQVLVCQAKQMLAVRQNQLRRKTGNYW
jgi:hypothetical protein